VQRTLTAAFSLVMASGVRFIPAQAPTQPGTQSQPPIAAGEVRGKVVDTKSDAPIARASVAIRPKGATAILAGAIAGPDGAFRVPGLRPGTYQ
jgi:hypothetical protein